MNNKYLYFSPLEYIRVQFNVQGSRFIGTLVPASDEKAAHKAIEEVAREYPDATHHAYALRIGVGTEAIERAADDREPAGTAGAPMLQYLQGQNVSDLVVVATRYFGGTKLGIGGLTRAYRECARLALDQAELVRKEPFEQFILELHYDDYGSLTRLIDSNEGKIISVEYSNIVSLHLSLPERKGETFIEQYISLCRGKGRYKKC